MERMRRTRRISGEIAAIVRVRLRNGNFTLSHLWYRATSYSESRALLEHRS
jgi:hypothetical protein